MSARQSVAGVLASLALLFASHPVMAQQVQVKPWFFLVVDTSGSMDDSAAPNSCSYPSNKMGAARCAIRNILDSTGDAEFALMQFKHRCRSSCTDLGGGDYNTECTPDIDNLEPIASGSSLIRQWVDNACTGSCTGGVTKELYAVGYTPLGASLVAARDYFRGTLSGKTSPTATDVYAGCRPVNVILLTDGAETCGGNANNAATSLLSTVVPTPSGTTTLAIKTYVIGFGISPGDSAIESIALNGNTDAPGSYRGFYASDEETLSSALNSIIIESQINEVCDGQDNDCDTFIDEDHPKFCDVNAIRSQNPLVADPNSAGQTVDQGSLDARLSTCNSSPCAAVSGVQGNALCAQPEWSSSSDPSCAPANILCTSPGELCNAQDDDCDGVTDEGAPQLASTAEICNDGTDNDCDGTIDENCAGCTPEVCDGVDNDCDGTVDNITRPCGVNLGVCTAGTETCTAGVWGACTGQGGSTEICDNLDNDCDGVTDGLSRACGSSVGECQEGTERCTAAAWGTCTGAIGPSAEICDGKDNDCDALNDDGDDDARVGKVCGTDTGVCSSGAYICAGGGLQCSGSVLGSAELCDGLDNDCDGNVDEGVDGTDPTVAVPCVVSGAGAVIIGAGAVVQGECRLGTTQCRQGALACDGYTGPTPELCDALDQDCDGDNVNGVAQTDPRVGDECGSANGVCELGQLQCLNEMLVCDATVLPGVQTETCNGIDDNCDGVIDEGNPGGGAVCDSTGHMGQGECANGIETCLGGTIVCQGEIGPTPEECDNLDNDCDGSVDEGAPIGVGGSCGSDVGECQSGQLICQNGVLTCPDDVGPGVELCDGKDNDCDGRSDESPTDVGGTCVPNNGTQPGSCRRSADPSNANLAADQLCGTCKWGLYTCKDGALQCSGYVGPKDEVCNGLDDDCDYPCLRLDTNQDGTIDTIKCPSTCNDPLDPDCDSLIDEGVSSTDPNVGAACGSNDTGECQKGSQACEGGSYVCIGEIKPTVEVCNGLDDDCDGNADDGIPVGNACGNDVGECQTGRNVCDPASGSLTCDGQIGPGAETCDLLDNDCDGKVDEALGLGGECGTDEGECSLGNLACDKGREVCVGEESPQVETCDCLDNDCDGKVDEDMDAANICPGTSACVMCQCALPCAAGGEFSESCPTGKAAVTVDGECRCVGTACDATSCAEETIEDPTSGEARCAPAGGAVGACVCRENACTFRCDGKVCAAGLICDAMDGTCKAQSCLLSQFACADGERCDPSVLDCVPDACADASCDGPCRDGECFESCNLAVPCKAGEVCRSGACQADKCANVRCAAGETCSPTSGKCIAAAACVSSGCSDGFVCDADKGGCEPDPCLATRCGTQDRCEGGECVARCAAGLLSCDESCINPSRNRNFCGASADCDGDNRGEACEQGAVCSSGACKDSCDEGFVACDGGCIDPMTDRKYCGATAKCDEGEAGATCAPGEGCEAGVCRSYITGGGDNTDSSGPIDEPAPESRKLVLGTGGSACACSVPGATPSESSTRPLLLLAGLVMALGVRRRRLRLGRVPLSTVLTGLSLLLVSYLGGCKIDPYCVNCQDQDDNAAQGGPGGSTGGAGSSTSGGAGSMGSGGTGGTGAGGTGSTTGAGGTGTGGTGTGGTGTGGTGTGGTGAGGTGTGGTGAGGDGAACGVEVCNGKDDDCDDTIDEDVDPAAEGIDLQKDLNHCGSCGNKCVLASAFATCVAGACQVDSCDVGYVDLDGQGDNGCELRCNKTATDDSRCDQRDNDCDGKIDEDIDFQSDAANCSSCGFSCGFPHAQQAACIKAACALRSTDCDTNYYDVNGSAGDGCEYFCEKAAQGKELCNKKDDDCDGRIDEDVATDDPAVGQACGTDTGECVAGVKACGTGASAGQIVCQGEVVADTEVCDSLDNDCDGQVDEEDNAIGATCGSNVGVCSSGSIQCNAGSLSCTGAVTGSAAETCDGLDNDCDGAFDEAPVDIGIACSTSTGSLVENPPPPVGLCAAGLTACSAGGLTCTGETGPATEVCDGQDNDCDGNVDETDPQVGRGCGNTRGECSAGTWACSSGALTCSGGQTPVAEVCNGRDDDCDGQFDEGVAATDPAVGVACGSTVGECTPGVMQCVSGSVACVGAQGPRPELCDSKDWDCDGQTLANLADVRVGQRCPGSDIGECNAGVYVCAAGSLSCTGVVGPAPELCDGRDNDCDGAADDGADEPTIGAACGSAVGACSQGQIACVGGNMQCAGQVLPQAETCDVLAPADLTNPANDDDCDGAIDEDFQLDTNPANCGFCNVQCSIPNAISQCSAGACQIVACQSGYHGADCSIGPCQINGAEVCNGADDDCNGSVDDGLSAPTCNTVGACAGATAQCNGASGFQCSVTPVSEVCNGADDDCDGSVDEGFGLGASCAAAGVGACATRGTLACDPTDTSQLATRCEQSPGVPAQTGTAGAEVCNGLDDDCDGTVDEPCAIGVSNSGCVSDSWVTMGSGVEVYKYEASRPDATAEGSGTKTGRACSSAARLPWTNVSYASALAACQGAGGRLCAEGEWEEACMDDLSGSCYWPYPTFAQCDEASDYDPSRCNGADYNATPAIQASGASGAAGACFRSRTSDGNNSIYELSGNVKEYALQRASGAIPVRGGAHNNLEFGLACDFNFPVWPDESPFTNVGFRCCRGATLPDACGTVALSGLSASNSSQITSILSVPHYGTLKSLSLVGLSGTTNNFNEITKMELIHPDGTIAVLFDSTSTCPSWNRDDWDLRFVQGASTTWPPANGNCGGGSLGVGENSDYAPKNPFTGASGVFTGKAAKGDWTLRIADGTTGSNTPTLTAWGLELCVDQN